MKLPPVLATIALGALLCFAAPADAAPREGTSRQTVTLVDAWDRQLVVAHTGTKPILVVYEDKNSAEQNIVLKRELAQLAKGGAYRTAVTLLAIADVGGYDYWPVRGFVKDAIQSESKKFDTTIYCDWDGSVRRTLGVRGGVSSVVLYSRDGKVLFAREGTLSQEERTTLFGLLRTQLATS